MSHPPPPISTPSPPVLSAPNRSSVIGVLAMLLLLAAGCQRPETASLDTFLASARTHVPTYAAGYTTHTLGDTIFIKALDYGAQVRQRYLLVPREAPGPGPAMPPDVQRIGYPVRSVVVTSTTQIAMLERLGLLDRVVAVAGADLVSSPTVLARVADGTIADVGRAGELDYERILALQPDLVMSASLEGLDGEAMQRLRAQGLPVAVTSEFREATPLGRAEWLHMAALFFGQEEAALDTVRAIAQRYEALADTARAQPDRPSVLLNAAFRGTWYVPGGQNYMARFLEDAGAQYLWSDTDVAGSGSLALDVEAVLDRAQDADYWLNVNRLLSLEQIEQEDPRYALFEAWQEGRVYNNTKRMTPTGGIDFWESGIVWPDVILADLTAIFHPELVPDHTMVYYEQLPPTAP